jgi:uncharacterized protein
MKIKPEQIERIASQLVANYHDQDLIVAKAADGALKAKIIEARIAQHRRAGFGSVQNVSLGEAKARRQERVYFMNRLSESRISHLAHLVMDGLRKANLGDFPNEGRALTQTKQVLHGFFQREDQIDDIVRQKIDSLSRRVPPGSREWDILYRKYFEEEARKQRR